MGSATIASKNNQASHLVAYGIKLPFPSAIEVGTNYNWSSEETGVTSDLVRASGRGGITGEDISALVQRAGVKVGSAVGGTAVDVGLKGEGLAINPKNEMLFRGVEFRQFALQWELVPTTAGESTAYAKAIELLHEMAAPGLSNKGAFFTYPETTTVVVQKDDGKKIINRPNSAITSINVDLTPDGIWAQLKDGRPVHTTLRIEFMELDLPTKKNVPKLLGE